VAGACHALEIPFVFGALDHPGAELVLGGAPGEDVWALSHRLQDAWLAFARTGDPSTPELAWPAWTPDDRRLLRLDLEPVVEHDPDRRVRELWEGLV
jgi:para-nitrobenzyl esterase